MAPGTRWRAPALRAVSRTRVYVRDHPRVGVALLAVVALAVIGLGGGLFGGGGGSRSETARSGASPAPLPTGERRGPFRVVQVVDGETLRVDEGGTVATVRLLGIDAPTLADFGVQTNCLAASATRALTAAVGRTAVDLENDPTAGATDENGQQFAYVYAGSTLVNEALLRDGFADQYADGRAYRYQSRFLAAEQVARTAGLGVWSPGGCAIRG